MCSLIEEPETEEIHHLLSVEAVARGQGSNFTRAAAFLSRHPSLAINLEPTETRKPPSNQTRMECVLSPGWSEERTLCGWAVLSDPIFYRSVDWLPITSILLARALHPVASLPSLRAEHEHGLHRASHGTSAL
jgi:hypothetical protein